MVGDGAWTTGNKRLRLIAYVTYVEIMSHTQLHIYKYNYSTNWDEGAWLLSDGKLGFLLFPFPML